MTTYDALDSSGYGRTAFYNLSASRTALWHQAGPYGGGSRNYCVDEPYFTSGVYNPTGPNGWEYSVEMFIWARLQTGGNGSFYLFNYIPNGGNSNAAWGFYFGGLNPGHGWTDPQDLADIQNIFVVNVVTGFMPLNGWHHFAARSTTSGHFDVFLDGVFVANVPNNPAQSSGAMVIGAGPQFDGKLAGVATFNYNLTDAQIANHYAARTSNHDYRAAILADSPQGLWMLDEPNPTGWAVGRVSAGGVI